MPVSDFLSKFESLDPKGDPDRLATGLGELRAEVQEDASELRAERLAAEREGKKPAYCPAADAVQPTAEEIVAALEEIPEGDRPLIEVKDALRGYLAYRFPC
ncbi:MAG TPA: hypothetical protein VH392_07580 [Sphingomicrobium sp.]|jgi:hypothetical protein